MTRASFLPSVLLEDRPKLLPAMGTFACAASAALLARTAGSTLFLSGFSPARLPVMYAAAAVTLLATSLGLGWLNARFGRRMVLFAVPIGLAACALVVRLFLSSGWRGAAVLAYLLGELGARIPALLFWSEAALVFNPREARRSYGFIGLAGTGMCILVGALVGPFCAAFGAENLLFVVVAALLLFAHFGTRIPVPVEAVQDRGSARGGTGGFGLRGSVDVLRGPHVTRLALLVGAGSAALMMTDYLFLSAARDHYGGAQLAGFLGRFYGSTSIGTLVMQAVVVPGVLHRGLLPAAIAMPAALLALAFGVFATGSFGWTVAARSAEPILDFTLGATAVQMFYLGVPRSSRAQAKRVVEGQLRPLVVVVTGLVLTVLALHTRGLALAVMVASATWLAAVLLAHRSYVEGLVTSIESGRFDPDSVDALAGDPAIANQVREAMRSAPDESVLYVLDTARGLPGSWTDDFRGLLSRSHPELRIAALDYLAENGDASDVAAMREALLDERPSVREAATRALAARGGSEAVQAICGRLVDPDRDVRGAATAALIRYGDVDGLIEACLSLKRMLVSDPLERAAAARILARLEVRGLARTVSTLLDDPDHGVREAALEACAAHPAPELAPKILAQLEDASLAPVATDALVALGPNVLPHLASFPAEAKRDGTREALLHIPDVLARTGEARALYIVAGALDVPDLRLRARVVEAYCQLVRRRGATSARPSEIRRVALAQLADARERLGLMRSLEANPDTSFLLDLLADERDVLFENAVQLAGLIFPTLPGKSIVWGATRGSAANRAEAVEVLDNVLEGQLKTEMIALLEPPGAPTRTPSLEEPVRRLLAATGSEWLIASAAYAAGRGGLMGCLPELKARLDHPSPLVRETVQDAVARLERSGGAAPAPVVPG